jgi:hypothetical protein
MCCVLYHLAPLFAVVVPLQLRLLLRTYEYYISESLVLVFLFATVGIGCTVESVGGETA